MPTATSTKALKPYPYKGSGVNENAAVRMVKMVVPQCPCESDADAQRIEDAFERQGLKRRTRPIQKYRGIDNCQSGRFRYGWWEDCEAKGHNPYWSSTVTQREETVTDENGYVTGTRIKEVIKEHLNVVQVPVSRRHDSGQAVPLARQRGAKFLHELGFKNVCEMRNCENPARLRFKFGEFCSERHARLVQADNKKVMLIVGGDEESQWQEKREEQLQELALGPVTKID